MCFDEEPDDPCMVCREKSLAALDKLRLERDALDKLATQRATEVNRLRVLLMEARGILDRAGTVESELMDYFVECSALMARIDAEVTNRG